MADKKMLELRKRIKSKKPLMIRQDWYKKTRLAKVWRRPKGLHSKFRHRRKEREGAVEPGWGSPREAKWLHSSGLEFVVVNSPSELEKIAKDTQGIVLAAAVGSKKKIDIVKLAMKKNISILNLKNPAEWIAKKELELEQRKKEKIKKQAKPEEKKLGSSQASSEPKRAALPEEKKTEQKTQEKVGAQSEPTSQRAGRAGVAEEKKIEMTATASEKLTEEKKEAEKKEKDKLLTKRTV